MPGKPKNSALRILTALALILCLQSTLVSGSSRQNAISTLNAQAATSFAYDAKYDPESGHRAAMNGIQWIIDNKDRIPEGFGYLTFKYLYKTVRDEQLAAELKSLSEEAKAKAPQADIPESFDSPDYLQWNMFAPIMTELIYRKESGGPYEQAANGIQELINKYPGQLLNAQAGYAHRIIVLYLIEKLGLKAEKTRLALINDIRADWDQSFREIGQIEYVSRIYALTHIIVTDSDYYSHYLDAKDYYLEIAHFKNAIEYHRNMELNDFQADALSQILICYRLLNLPFDEGARVLAQRIMERQNQDGSWGGDPVESTTRIHHTITAVLGLMQFAHELR